MEAECLLCELSFVFSQCLVWLPGDQTIVLILGSSVIKRAISLSAMALISTELCHMERGPIRRTLSHGTWADIRNIVTRNVVDAMSEVCLS